MKKININMRKETLSLKAEIIIHVIYWLLMAYFIFAKNPIQTNVFVLDLFFITYCIVFVFTFYFHYLIVMKRVFKAFQWKIFFAGVLVSYLFFTLLRWLIEQVITAVLFDKINYINPEFLTIC
ncbi:hypothetical protein [Flavobacterium sp. YO12]|uniref:hypothetical protein n=1 Tax=Flavobacterium sp. YO12 TaxID=1920029 RepID=UPI001F5136E1|nr:hypothetical protein [Flavobacterium sp. YO12]